MAGGFTCRGMAATVACSDCGLVHRYKVKVKDGRAYLQAIRLSGATRSARRQMPGQGAGARQWLTWPVSDEKQFTLAGTWPARLGMSALSALALPGDVWQCKVDPMSDEGFARMADLAGLIGGTSFVRSFGGAAARRLAPAAAQETMASRSPMLYDPPAKPARPFAADYPAGAPA